MLDFQHLKNLQDVSLQDMEKLSSINLDGARISKMHLQNLKELYYLNLSKTENTKELFLDNVNSINRISLNDSNIETLVLKNVRSIQNLDFRNLSSLRRVVFEGDFPLITSLSFNNSVQLESIEGLEHLKKLRTLNVSGATNLETLNVEESNKDLRLQVKGSGLTRSNIKGLEHLNEDNIEW
jgi:hypothetical protein